MPATPCNTCSELITFVLNATGRWRPVDVNYKVFELEGDELLAVQEDGVWRQQAGRVVRVYTAHACIDNPSWNRGQARTREVVEEEVVDTATGEIVEPDRPWQQQRATRDREWLVRHYRPETLAVECPLCHAPVQHPCVNDFGRPMSQPHTNRNWRIAFSDSEPWPPRHNSKGFKAMHSFLRDNPDLFALPIALLPPMHWKGDA